MIQFDDILFRYAESSFELRLTTLQLADGEAIALTGRSGCGKTTLLNLLAGILLPQQGQVRVGDVTVSQLPDAARRLFRLQHMGLVFQDFQLIDYLNVLDNVLLPCRLSGAVPLDTDIRDRAVQLVRHAGLEQYFRRSVTRLSQGERQRVAICRALLLRPELVLADEPTGNLDPRTADQILSLLMTQCRDHGATLVMVTHDQTLLPVFDRVIACDEYFHATVESHPNAEAGADTRGVVR